MTIGHTCKGLAIWAPLITTLKGRFISECPIDSTVALLLKFCSQSLFLINTLHLELLFSGAPYLHELGLGNDGLETTVLPSIQSTHKLSIIVCVQVVI